jgi:hypothetical protein
LSIEWTTKRAEYRKLYQKARQLLAAGVNVRVPNAKDHRNGDVLRYSNGTVISDPKVALVKAAKRAN